jgi:hypothetical protein
MVEKLPAELATGSDPVYSVGTFDHSLTFYLRRTATLVAFRNELDFGLTLEPHKGIDSLEQWVPRWQAERQALGVMDRTTYELLMKQGVPMVLRAENPKRLIVSRR